MGFRGRSEKLTLSFAKGGGSVEKIKKRIHVAWQKYVWVC